MINPKAREWTFGPILKLLATLLALLVVLACVGSSGAPPASPTPPPGMFSTLPTTEPPVVGDHPPTIELKTLTPNPTYSPVPTPTPYPTATPYPTFTPQPTYTPPVPTPTPYPTATPYPTFTPQPTYTPPVPTPTPTPYPTATPYPTFTPQPTYTPVPTTTPYPTATPYPTFTPRPTYTPVPTTRPRPTNTPVPTAISYFTRGSTQDEVLSVQGTPTEIHVWEYSDEEWWDYGRSRVVFSLSGGRVTEWRNTGNLRVRLVPAEFHQIDFFTRGSTQDEVLSVQGTPTEIHVWEYSDEEWWDYGRSRVVFSLSGGRVTEWRNTGNLRVRLVPGG